MISIESMWDDVVSAFRSLRSRPGIAVTVVGMLSLAIGAATAMFTTLDALILRPVPFRGANELAIIYMGNDRGGRTTVAPAVLRAWQDSAAFSGAESAIVDTALLEAGDSVAVRRMARVTPGLFDLLGDVRPIRGRLFDRSEGRAGSDDRVLLSDDLWRSFYQRDPAIVGRRIVIDGRAVTVVGILPSEFRFPSWDTVIWLPIQFDHPPPGRAGDRPNAYVRFTAHMPRAEALRIATDAARRADSTNVGLRPYVQPVAGLVPDAYDRRAAPLLAGGVVLMFVALCSNVCGLLLAQLIERRREFCVRAALGASRWRLMRQALVASTVISAVGIVAGAGVGWALVSLARTFLPEALLLRTLNPLNIDLRALAATSVSGVAATFSAGLLPAWIGARVDAAESLRVLHPGATETPAARAATRGLLIAEIALACTLLAGAALLVRSFVNLTGASRGLHADRIMTATMALPASAFPDRSSRAALARLVDSALRGLPGVQQITWSYGVPPDRRSFSSGEWTADFPGAPAANMTVDSYEVGADFFALYGIPFLRGRTFQPSDTDRDVIVGERLARVLWPGLDPIGRRFSRGRQQYQVIGLVDEIHYPAIDTTEDRPEFYRPFAFGDAGRSGTISIRCGATCPDAALVRRRLTAAHPAGRPLEVRSLEEAYLEQLARPRAAAALALAFAATALLAAAGGLFSVLSYAVGRRRREFGVRAALGASAADIRRVLFRDVLLVVSAGAAIGIAAAAFTVRTLASLQYGVSAGDPAIWALVLGLLASAVAAAAWRPVKEAIRADPVVLLREE